MALEKQPKRNEPGKGLVPTVSGRAKKSLPGQDRAEGNGGRDHGEGGRRAQEEQQWTYPPGAGSAEDIIDAEIVEDEPAD